MESPEHNGIMKTRIVKDGFYDASSTMNSSDAVSGDEENDEDWENSWPVEVSIETPAHEVEGGVNADDSDGDFYGFDDVELKEPVRRTRFSDKCNRCPHCDYRTRRKDHFKRHVLRHPEQTLYPLDGGRRQRKPCICAVCGYTTMRSDHFKRHMMRHTGERPYACTACKYATTHAIHLKRHIQRHGHHPNSHLMPPDIPELNGFEIKREPLSNGNIDIIQTNGVEIKREPLSNGNVDIPELNGFEVKREPLSNGNIGEDEALPLDIQLKTEIEDQDETMSDIVSNGDGGGEDWVSGLWPVEVNLEEEARPGFVEELPIKRRKRREKGPHVCKECGYATLRGDHFKRHLMRHTGEKPYSCSVCEYRSTHAIHLKRHMSVHTDDRPYACHFCPFRAIRPHHLRDHIRIHTGERPYVCHLCGFSASQSGNYKSHMRTHYGHKPYTCELCGYSTVKNSNLVAHLRVHRGEKSFSCDLCDYKAMKSGEIARHKLRLHPHATSS